MNIYNTVEDFEAINESEVHKKILLWSSKRKPQKLNEFRDFKRQVGLDSNM